MSGNIGANPSRAVDVATNRGIKGGLQYCSGLVLSVDAIEIIEKSNNLSEFNEVVEVLISIPLVKLYCLVKERSAETFNFHYNSKLILRLCNIDI